MISGLCVLFLGDSDADMMLVARELKLNGLKAACTRIRWDEPYRTALEADEWDLVIADGAAARVDCLQAIGELKRRRRDVPFIVLSDALSDHDVAHFMQAGAQECIPKTQMARLAPAIERSLHLDRVVAEMQTAEHKFQVTFRALPVMIALSTMRGGRFLDVNPAFLQTLGYARGEVIGKTFQELGILENAEDRERLRGILTSGRSVRDFEVGLRTRSGDRRVGLLTGDVIRIQGQTCLLTSALDITGRVRMEEAQRTLAREWQATFDAVSDAVWLLGPDGKIRRCNKASLRFFNCSSEDLVGAFCHEVVHATASPISDCPMRRMCSTRRRESMELNLKGRWVKVTVDPILDAAGGITGIVHILSDITEHRRLEEEARARRDQLLQASKMASLGILVSGVAHEINNPANFITLNGPLLQDIWRGVAPILEERFRRQGDFPVGTLAYSAVRENVGELLQGVLEGGERIRRIVKELKDYARVEPENVRVPVNLNEVVKTAISLMRNRLDKSTRDFRVAYGEALPSVLGSFQKLEQVLINLLQNACDALPDRDRGIRIATTRDPSGGGVVVTVTDQGEGIPPEAMPHILDPFYTTKRSTGGVGLGLPISASIVEQHQGALTFDSAPGRGTTVTLRLPAVPAS